MKIIIALLVFSVIIIFHELGHFLLAKRAGVTVTEFSLGMGPRLLSFQAGGTRYSWRLLPFGGSCMMLGEDEGDEGEGTFGSKSVWARMSIIVAGPLFNFLLAFLMALFIVGSIGYDGADPDRRRRRDAGRGCRTAGRRPNHKNERQTYPAVATGTELFHVSFRRDRRV